MTQPDTTQTFTRQFRSRFRRTPAVGFLPAQACARYTMHNVIPVHVNRIMSSDQDRAWPGFRHETDRVEPEHRFARQHGAEHRIPAGVVRGRHPVHPVAANRLPSKIARTDGLLLCHRTASADQLRVAEERGRIPHLFAQCQHQTQTLVRLRLSTREQGAAMRDRIACSRHRPNRRRVRPGLQPVN